MINNDSLGKDLKAVRALLKDSYEFQQLERDSHETKGWINKKVNIACDNYLDPTNGTLG